MKLSEELSSADRHVREMALDGVLADAIEYAVGRGWCSKEAAEGFTADDNPTALTAAELCAHAAGVAEAAEAMGLPPAEAVAAAVAKLIRA